MAKQTNNILETRDTRVTASRQLWSDFDYKMNQLGIVNRSEMFRNLFRAFVRNEDSKGVQNGPIRI